MLKTLQKSPGERFRDSIVMLEYLNIGKAIGRGPHSLYADCRGNGFLKTGNIVWSLQCSGALSRSALGAGTRRDVIGCSIDSRL